ncbi:tyrosine-type recombinase/integrase, partial [Candidatus Magnetaquicoccus inordinatus]|uniref:tyrosine-type recombinase/integrase n=1 Tax=Candidatus Magnetaquicoccus inordinatus TaxID=2496818 RepID=UPI00102CD852
LTPEQARKEAIDLLAKVANGEDPAEEKAASKAMPTMAELCDLYIQEGTTTQKPSTVATDRGRILRHVIPLLGRKRIDQITLADIERFRDAVASGKTAADIKTGVRGRAIVTGGEGTANRTLELLSGIFSFACRRHILSNNPCQGVKKFRRQTMERFLSGEELARLGEAMQEAESEGVNPVAIAALRLLLLTGMRRGEVLTLQWSFVDFELGCLRLPDTKTGSRTLHIGAAAIALLAGLPRIEGNPFCFPGLNEGRSLVGLPKVWRKIRDRAGLSEVRIHDTRHGFASVGVISGMGLPIVGALLGHKSPTITARYAHLSADPLKAAADAISGQIAASLDRKPAAEVVPIQQKRTRIRGG